MKGGVAGAGVTIRNARVGVSTPLNNDWLDLTKPKAVEVGYNPGEKLDVDAGVSISIPLIKTGLKY